MVCVLSTTAVRKVESELRSDEYKNRMLVRTDAVKYKIYRCRELRPTYR